MSTKSPFSVSGWFIVSNHADSTKTDPCGHESNRVLRNQGISHEVAMRHPIWILAFLLTPTLVQAQALGVQAKLKDGKLHVEVYYDDNSPAIKATIKVMKGKDEIKTG